MTLTERINALQQESTQLAGEFFSSRPLGSFVSMAEFNRAMSNLRVNLMHVQEYLDENSDRTFWVVKREGRTVGFFMISAEALQGYLT